MGIDRDVLSVASVVVLGAIMSILDTTIVNVALDTLGRELHSSLSDIQWVATGYLLALSTVIPLTGWAMERFGGKRMWMTSVALFLLGSTLCGFAWSTSSLIGFRVLQGFGGGMIMPIGQAILAQAAGPQRMGRVMSVIGVPTLLGPILGPVIGGLIVDSDACSSRLSVASPTLTIVVSRIDMIAPITTTDATKMIPRSSLSSEPCVISVSP